MNDTARTWENRAPLREPSPPGVIAVGMIVLLTVAVLLLGALLHEATDASTPSRTTLDITHSHELTLER